MNNPVDEIIQSKKNTAGNRPHSLFLKNYANWNSSMREVWKLRQIRCVEKIHQKRIFHENGSIKNHYQEDRGTDPGLFDV